jgi:hypothetical protein
MRTLTRRSRAASETQPTQEAPPATAATATEPHAVEVVLTDEESGCAMEWAGCLIADRGERSVVLAALIEYYVRRLAALGSPPVAADPASVAETDPGAAVG